MDNTIIIIILLLIILIILVLYSLYGNILFINNFDDITAIIPTTTTQVQTLPKTPAINFSITQQIASLLSISSGRVQNLTYSDIIDMGVLTVSFTINEPNFIETYNGELSSADTNKKLITLINMKLFNINIAGQSLILNYSPLGISSQSLLLNDLNYAQNPIYFNNKANLDIANYAHNVYTVVPTDASVIKFYSLDMDKNFNTIVKSP
uniref:Uncharacterized protein n=1 Tax=viral metagenome TaxID=1070528 RepID=A0A6C0HKV9_9ZZZZ